MAEYYAVLSRAITGLTNASPETRRAVYDKARNALISQLKAIVPPLPVSEISRQRLELEEAIRRVERELQAGTIPSSPREGQAAPSVPVPPAAVLPRPTNARIGASVEPPAPDGDRRSPQEIFRQAILDAEGRGGQGGAGPRQGPRDRPVSPPVPMIRTARAAPTDVPGTEPDMGELGGLVPDMQPQPITQSSRRSRGYEPPVAPNEPRLAPDYDYEGEPEPAAIRSPMERGREMRLGPAPIDPEIDDVAPSRRGSGPRGEAPSGDMDAPVPRRRSRAPLLLLLLIMVLAGGIGALAWTQRSTITAVIASFDTPPAPKSPATLTSGVTGGGEDAASNKNSERLLSPGTPDRAVRQVGSGTPPTGTAPNTVAAPSTAPQTTTTALAPPSSLAPGGQPLQPSPAPAAPAQPQASLAPPPTSAQPQAVAPGATVTQKATLYEEPGDPSVAATSTLAIAGTVTWSYVASGPDGPEVEGTVAIPDRKMTVKVTIRRNKDTSLPASHLVELLVTTPSDFPGKGVQQVPTIVLKPSEDGRGDVLTGAAATVASGYYWVALSNGQKDVTNNLGLLRDRGWIDIRLVYTTGQRAILTLEKGPSGTTAFAKALTAWQAG